MAKGTRNDYLIFLDRVSDKKRKDMAQTVRDAPLGSMEDVAYFCSGIISEILEGNIPPSIADSAHPYVELLYTAVASSNINTAEGRSNFSSVLGKLQEAANNAKTLEAKYVVNDLPKEEKEKVVIDEAV